MKKIETPHPGSGETEKKLLAKYRTAPVGIGIVADDVMIEANETLCEMTGYSMNELLGRNSRMLYLDDDEYLFLIKKR